ncbi:MAG TPA: hypothetical protein VHB48_14140, partial [Chitinophagaceae bacterium]|nr:hypothetical protein [Chitinophagaceae bacterium]
RDNRKIIYAILIILLLGTWGYIIYDKNQSTQKFSTLQTQYSSVDSERNAIAAEYRSELAKEDSLSGANSQLKGQLAANKAETEKARKVLEAKLNNRTSTIADLRKALADYQKSISDMTAQIEQLKQENQQLTAANQQLTTEKDTLTAQKQVVEQNLASTTAEKQHVEDIGSTLHASAINITPINVKGNGKEVETSKAKRADLLRVSFKLDENRIAPSGNKDLYVCVTGPDGKPITMPDAGSGSFTTRDEGDKVFTKQVSVNYTQGQALPVSFDWKPSNGKFLEGDYKIQIYQNGFKIGEGIKTLKKAGFLG